MRYPLMKCGHVAQGIDQNNNPVCVICFGISTGYNIIESDLPSLEGRKAKCTSFSCGKIVDSDWGLAFFEYCGSGSDRALNMCKCGFYKVAHGKGGKYSNGERNPYICENKGGHFEPIGDSLDNYYCGHAGWD